MVGPMVKAGKRCRSDAVHDLISILAAAHQYSILHARVACHACWPDESFWIRGSNLALSFGLLGTSRSGVKRLVNFMSFELGMLNRLLIIS
jgi:hypothetical protein